MIWYIISALTIILTLGVLKDIHVKVYERVRWEPKLVDEFDLPLVVWQALIIVLIGLVPVLNILCFVAFIIWYIISSTSNPKDCISGYSYVLSLNRRNFITKSLLKIEELLCKKI